MNFEQQIALGARPLNCLSPQVVLVVIGQLVRVVVVRVPLILSHTLGLESSKFLFRCHREDLRLAAVSPASSHKRRDPRMHAVPSAAQQFISPFPSLSMCKRMRSISTFSTSIGFFF